MPQFPRGSALFVRPQDHTNKYEIHTLDAYRNTFDAYRSYHTSHISIAHSKTRHHSTSLLCYRAFDAGCWRDQVELREDEALILRYDEVVA
jgi:hypothetical protein